VLVKYKIFSFCCAICAYNNINNGKHSGSYSTISKILTSFKSLCTWVSAKRRLLLKVPNINKRRSQAAGGFQLQKNVRGYGRASLTTEKICSRTQVIYLGFMLLTWQKEHPGAIATILQAGPYICTAALLVA